MAKKTIALRFDPLFLKEIDALYKEKGFHNRTQFIEKSCKLYADYLSSPEELRSSWADFL